MKAPPVLALVWRSGRVESLHRGDVAVVDDRGALRACSGDPRRRVYLRSAAKPFQAMVLLAAGGERAFGLDHADIALLCASHGGEPRHVRTARRLLALGGFTAADLACGAQLPMNDASARSLVARGRAPSALHNNCSGKHAGLLLACRLHGFEADGYCDPRHPIQQLVLERVARFCGVPAARIGLGVDGCSLPVFFLPLAALATGYARLLAAAIPGESGRERAIRRRIRRAMCESSEMVAGRERFTTDFLRAGRGRWVGKEGAEGVYAMGLAPRGPGGRAVGIAFKIEDGSTRARDAVALEILAQLERLPAAAARRLERYRAPAVRTVAGRQVGVVGAALRLTRPAASRRTGRNGRPAPRKS